jgi:acyl-CoA reductase-like NAD-dependent aldehyde dehydrogenase
VTLGRIFSDTFAGIAPSSAPSFVAMQLVGAAAGAGAVLILYPSGRSPRPVTRLAEPADS